MKNIVLTGLSGSGKSTLGRMAADELGIPFIDMDKEIERHAGMTINEIFQKNGEGFFRDLESQVARESSLKEGAVIATGGGAVLREENLANLRKNGLIVFLDRPAELIAQDIECGDRPLLAGGADQIYALSKERRPVYLASADVVLQNKAGLSGALAGLMAAIRAETINGGYAVIGDPIAHTLSPKIHGAVFANLGVPETYAAVHVPKGKLAGFVRRVRDFDIRGFNVTLPHKCDIIPFLDGIEDEAASCGVVNTVVNRNGKLYGYNTDMNGLSASLKDIGYGFRGRRVLILGAGGAAGSIALKAAKEKATGITILARRPEKADEIRAGTTGIIAADIDTGDMSAGVIAEKAKRADILINCTPLGMDGISQDFDSTDFLKSLPKSALVYDLIYSPPQTKLLRDADALCLVTQNGLGMLIYQALIADELYLNKELDKSALYKTVSNYLEQNQKGM